MILGHVKMYHKLNADDYTDALLAEATAIFADPDSVLVASELAVA